MVVLYGQYFVIPDSVKAYFVLMWYNSIHASFQVLQSNCSDNLKYYYYQPSYPYYYYNNQSSQNASNINSTKFYETRFVTCPFCGRQAHVKPTKTHRLMLRCDLCRALMFANGPDSQQYLLNLPLYQEYY